MDETMSLNGSLHVRSDDEIGVESSDKFDWLKIYLLGRGTFGCHVDDATTADRISQAFAELATRIRKRAHIPEPDLFEDVADGERPLNGAATSRECNTSDRGTAGHCPVADDPGCARVAADVEGVGIRRAG